MVILGIMGHIKSITKDKIIFISNSLKHVIEETRELVQNIQYTSRGNLKLTTSLESSSGEMLEHAIQELAESLGFTETTKESISKTTNHAPHRGYH